MQQGALAGSSTGATQDTAAEPEWKRAYQEINEFERLLMDDGAILIKFYLHITKDEERSAV